MQCFPCSTTWPAARYVNICRNPRVLLPAPWHRRCTTARVYSKASLTHWKKPRRNKLNPLQQVTYLGILNVLLPAQIITGVLIWGLQEWPMIAAQLGGFQILAMVHTMAAWLFAAFIVSHVYLTSHGAYTDSRNQIHD